TLREFSARGRTMFLSIHQIGDAARVCDRFVLLSGGRTRGEGTLDELSAVAASRGGARTTNLEDVVLALTWARVARRQGVARAHGIAVVVDFPGSHRSAHRLLVHPGHANLRRSERPWRDGGWRRRGVLAARRDLGANLQRVRAGRRLPPAVRRDPP